MGYYSHHNMKWPTERGVLFFYVQNANQPSLATEGIEIRV